MMEAFCDCGRWMPEGICEACEFASEVRNEAIDAAIMGLIDAWTALNSLVTIDSPKALRDVLDETEAQIDDLREMKL